MALGLDCSPPCPAVLCAAPQVHAEQLTTTAAATEAVVVAASGVGMGMVATSVSPALLPTGGLAPTQAHAGGLSQVGTYKRFGCSQLQHTRRSMAQHADAA
jgi:hypothetical protein